MTTEANPSPSGDITGDVLLYSHPEPLNPEQHGRLGLKRLPNPFGFAAQTHLIPLTVAEFQPAALSYPVIFVGPEHTPVAVMGLRENENLFVDETGAIDPQSYVPAFVRRYPFVFANDQASDRMILCIDRGAELVDENGGDVALFENGQPTEYTKNAMEFCREFETERRRTEDFVNLLNGLDLFDVKQAVFTPRLPDGSAGQPQLLAEYFAVSEEKLAKLPQEKVFELFQTGALQQVYAHIMSLIGWERLVLRSMRRQQQAANDVAGNA